MKLIFHDLTTPLVSFKCGPEALIPAAVISGVTGIGSSVIQGDMSSSNVKKQLAAQKEENQINRDWQTEQAEINRQFQSSMMQQAHDYQVGLGQLQQYYTQQNMAKQAEYNSPVYQSQQLREAGINPQVYFGQSASFSGSSAPAGSIPGAQSAPSGSMPGGVAGLSPVGYQPPNLQIGQILKDFADARKSMSETHTNDLMRDPLYKEVIAKLKNQELVNEYQQLSNYVFNNIKDVKIRREFVELSKAEAGLILATDQHQINELEQKYKQSLTRLNDMLTSLHSTEGILLGLKIKNFDKTLQSELATQASERSKNYQDVEESKQRTRFQKFDNDLRDRFDSEYAVQYVSELKSKGWISESQKQAAMQKIRRIKGVEDHNERFKDVDAFLHWFKGFLPFMDSTSDFIK